MSGDDNNKMTPHVRRAQREVLRALADSWQGAVLRDRINNKIHHSQALSMAALREKLGESFEDALIDSAIARLLQARAIHRLSEEPESYAIGDNGWTLLSASDPHERQQLRGNLPGSDPNDKRGRS